jgi:hypothetical protein
MFYTEQGMSKKYVLAAFEILNSEKVAVEYMLRCFALKCLVENAPTSWCPSWVVNSHLPYILILNTLKSLFLNQLIVCLACNLKTVSESTRYELGR